MKVLVLAPHPFYQERGTPIAVDLLLRVLSERGDDVGLLTFHEGEERVFDNVKIYRIAPGIKIRNIPPGLSWKKIISDIYMFFSLIRLLRKNRYDVVHAVEESAFMAMCLCPLWSIPYIYDMDSSMVTQIIDKLPFTRFIERPLRYLESLPIRYADAVVPVCDALAVIAYNEGAKNVTILKDVSLVRDLEEGSSVPDIREELGLKGYIAMYIGNLESYQGIDLMLKSFSIAYNSVTDMNLVIIGGSDEDIKKYSEMSTSLGIRENVYLLGRKPVAHIGQYMSQADILVSPRIQGVNTPMKIYSYLHSGRAVLATRLPTHTQVMDDETSKLAEPDKNSFAEAMLELLRDDELRLILSRNARELIEREHSYDAFRDKVQGLYSRIEQGLHTSA